MFSGYSVALTGLLADDESLMKLPVLYKYGREGHWFGTKIFLLYLLDAVYQVSAISFSTYFC